LMPRRRGRPPKMATSHPPQPQPSEDGAPDERPREELLKEIEYLRAEVAYLKKLDALLQSKKPAASKKKRK
jgi:transposase